MEFKITTEFQKTDPLLLAFSGGPDSVFLTEKMQEYGYKNLLIAYFQHNLRGEESIQEELFCRNFAKKRNSY